MSRGIIALHLFLVVGVGAEAGKGEGEGEEFRSKERGGFGKGEDGMREAGAWFDGGVCFCVVEAGEGILCYDCGGEI